jgi:hypothetical protein
MDFIPREYAARLDATVQLFAMARSSQSPFTLARRFITEMDCTLDLAYWIDEDDEICFELRGAQTDAGYVTRETDIAWFKLIEEGVQHDQEWVIRQLNEKVSA